MRVEQTGTSRVSFQYPHFHTAVCSAALAQTARVPLDGFSASVLPRMAPPRAAAARSAEAQLRDPELARYLGTVKADLKILESFLHEVPFMGVVFGSARTHASAPDAKQSRAVGECFADIGLEPNGGAGPGVMDFVPEAFLHHRERSDLHTHGINIVLGTEQKRNPHVEHGFEMKEFLFRKLALYYPALATVVMPGGLGTMDELFEVWAQRARNQHSAKLTTEQRDFFDPILRALATVATKDRALIGHDAWRCITNSNNIDAAVAKLPAPAQAAAVLEPVDQLATRFKEDLDTTMLALDRVPKATVVLGGRDLPPTDPTVLAARETSRLLTRRDVPLRVGNPSAIANAVVSGARAANPRAEVQGLMLRGEACPNVDGLNVLAEQRDFIIHKDMLTRHSNGLLVLPGGLGTLAGLFAVLTEIQTEKRERVPIVLMGNDYWKPIFRAMKQVMLSDTRQAISPEDIDLMVFTDDPAVAADALAGKPVASRFVGHEALRAESASPTAICLTHD